MTDPITERDAALAKVERLKAELAEERHKLDTIIFDAEGENAHLCKELAACEDQRDRNAELYEMAKAELARLKGAKGEPVPETDQERVQRAMDSSYNRGCG